MCFFSSFNSDAGSALHETKNNSQNHHIAALSLCMLILSDDVPIIIESDSWLTCINGLCLVTINIEYLTVTFTVTLMTVK